MGRGRLRSWVERELQTLVRVARGLEEADLFFTGGELVDVYSGRVIKANLAVKGDRIAYLGSSDQMVGSGTQVIDLKGRLLAPGYIEPHGHPFQLYNPVAYADHILTWGTTCSVNDNLLFMNLISTDCLISLVEQMQNHPVKMLWSARLDPQTYIQEATAKFTYPAVARLIQHPWFVQVGELTDWPSLIAGDQQMQRWMVEAAQWGKKAEGHAPGASENTLNPLAAAGVTACHESITADEVMRRLQLGMYAALRCSSLRPDLPQILEGLVQHQPLPWERMMLTTDSPTPVFLSGGFTDRLIKIAIAKGVPPITVYQMVTRNPAVYYGLDDEIGGLAPGRLADLLVLESLEEPTPLQVYADGRLAVSREGPELRVYYPQLDIDWQSLGLKSLSTPGAAGISAEWLLPVDEGKNSFPVMVLVDPVITRRQEVAVGGGLLRRSGGRILIEKDSGLCYAALMTRDQHLVAHGILQGFATNLGGIASSYTGSFDLLVIGQEPSAMLKALCRVKELGGGIVVVQEEQVIAEIALPLGGSMSPQGLSAVIHGTAQIETALFRAGYPHHDLIYSLLFLTSTHLPELRLTRDGVFSVKERQVLRRSCELHR
ncbi:MAG: adenine deaminase C-terminal domain-containing protein [Syntrophomonadaceae bacterium]|nr:adenine deaminase C-terminal domain-containing protein [Syntrophomonadaceae bacterium]